MRAFIILSITSWILARVYTQLELSQQYAFLLSPNQNLQWHDIYHATYKMHL